MVDQVRSNNIFNHTIWFWRANDLCVVRKKVSKCEWRRTVLFYTKRAACFILLLQKAVKRRRCGWNLIWSFEFIFSLYDLTSSSIETAIRGREKDDKTWDSYCTNTNQIQWTGNEIIISRSAAQVVINLKLRSYCLVSCPNPLLLARLKSFSVIHPIYVIPVACKPRFHLPVLVSIIIVGGVIDPCMVWLIIVAFPLYLPLFLLFFGYNTKSTVTYP